MPLFNAGGTWNANQPQFAVEPRVADAVLKQLLSEAPSVHVRFQSLVVAADMRGDTIRALDVRSPDGSHQSYAASYVLDATDLGDVLPLVLHRDEWALSLAEQQDLTIAALALALLAVVGTAVSAYWSMRQARANEEAVEVARRQVEAAAHRSVSVDRMADSHLDSPVPPTPQSQLSAARDIQMAAVQRADQQHQSAVVLVADDESSLERSVSAVERDRRRVEDLRAEAAQPHPPLDLPNQISDAQRELDSAERIAAEDRVRRDADAAARERAAERERIALETQSKIDSLAHPPVDG